MDSFFYWVDSINVGSMISIGSGIFAIITGVVGWMNPWGNKRNDEESTTNPQKTKQQKAICWIISGVLLLIMALSIVSSVVAKNLVEVPNVSKKTVAEAREKLDGVGLRFSDSLVADDDEIIATQTPNAYSIVKKNSVIAVELERDYIPEYAREILRNGNLSILSNPKFNANGGPLDGYFEKIVYDDGGIYSGDFKEGVPDGEGNYTDKDKNTYSGHFVQGLLSGTGTMTWTVGDSYTGDWMNGHKHGTGTYTWASGDSYTGDWVASKRQGTGTEAFANGDSYTGDYVEGKRHGTGTYTWVSGDSYTGDWAESDRHGTGTIAFANGNMEENCWVEGERQGNGTITYPDGRILIGTWEDNKKQGTFLYYDKDGQWIKEVVYDNDQEVID